MQVIKQRVEYEWKPILYEHCKIFGHEKQQGRKLNKQPEDTQKAQVNIIQKDNTTAGESKTDGDKVKELQHSPRRPRQQMQYKEVVVTTSNPFASLGEVSSATMTNNKEGKPGEGGKGKK